MRALAKTLIGLGMLSCLIGLPAFAGDSMWTTRFGLQFNTPSGDFKSGGQTTELDSANGLFASVEFKISERFGLEPGLDQANYDIEVKQSGFPTLDFGDVDGLALTLNGNFHLTPEKKVDVYIGPTIGYMFWDSISDKQFGGSIGTDDEFAIGANAGIDVPIGESDWSFAAAIRYLTLDLAIAGGPDIGVDPLQVKAGLAYGF